MPRLDFTTIKAQRYIRQNCLIATYFFSPIAERFLLLSTVDKECHAKKHKQLQVQQNVKIMKSKKMEERILNGSLIYFNSVILREIFSSLDVITSANIERYQLLACDGRRQSASLHVLILKLD